MSLLAVESLTVAAGEATLVDGVSFQLEPGDRLGLIGESGSGKTLTALSAIGLLPDGLSATGSVHYQGRDLLAAEERDLCTIRGDGISMVFQEPMTALNPVMRVGRQISEALSIHRGAGRKEGLAQAVDLLASVGIDDPESKARSFPHQLSGGQRQRALIAMAVACGPDIVIADEPTTALDVTIQAQVLRLLREFVGAGDTALLLITHDLPVVAGICDEVLVMHEGVIVERGPTRRVFDRPENPHTRRLVDSVPTLSRSSSARPADKPLSVAAEPMVTTVGVTRTFSLPRRSLLRRGGELTAVADVSIEVKVGESFGIVGESGSGKTTLARMLVGLDRASSGRIVVGEHELTTTADLRPVRAITQMVFQDPMSSLDPRMKVGDIIAEPLRALRWEGDHRKRVRELIEAVALPADSELRYPHEFSGGQRQRIAIARALAPQPRLLVADEPVSALDMSVQTRTLELLEELKNRFDLTLVFISHDLSVVYEICDRVAVMRRGRIVELGPVGEVYRRPRHPYTRGLLEAIPRLDGTFPQTA